ncbi:hypothetical protein NDU88_003268 [Pleurodeles waltl]|uniref:Uncharacterized protein n=1 Tax=Pleurodeles waltl TaxID=8319 RepID=A0AAV7SFB1_PLEWA|nr:hypothetical protein NDU88_003268 [Pleurodeles waltl]
MHGKYRTEHGMMQGAQRMHGNTIRVTWCGRGVQRKTGQGEQRACMGSTEQSGMVQRVPCKNVIVVARAALLMSLNLRMKSNKQENPILAISRARTLAAANDMVQPSDNRLVLARPRFQVECW